MGRALTPRPINYDGRVFRGKTNSPNGEVGSDTIFRYRQTGDRLSGEYSGGSIVQGQLLGKVLPGGRLEFCYQHLNRAGELMAGRCESTPVLQTDGKLVLEEEWRWLTGDRTSGRSEVEEIESEPEGPAAGAP